MATKGRNQTLRGYPLVRKAASLVNAKLRFDHDHVPLCLGETCRHHDGKRCSLTGHEPEQVCRPACARLINALMVLDRAIFGSKS